jgi:hypothetical protein
MALQTDLPLKTTITDEKGNARPDALAYCLVLSTSDTNSDGEPDDITGIQKIVTKRADSNGVVEFDATDLPTSYAAGASAEENYVVIDAKAIDSGSGEPLGGGRFANLNASTEPSATDYVAAYQLEQALPSSVSYRWRAEDLNLSDGDTGVFDPIKGGIPLQPVNVPVYRENAINGKAAFEYDGGEAHQNDEVNDSFGFTQPNYTVVVAKMDTESKNRVVTGNADDSGTTRQLLTLDNNGPSAAMYAGSFLGDQAAGTSWHIVGGYFNGANSEFRFDGSSVATGDAGSNGQTGITLGGNQGATSNFLNGKIAEVIIAESPTSSDISDIDSYLQTQYAL